MRSEAALGTRELLSNERGSVTAEFAIVLPAVLVVLALAVGAIMLSAQRLTLSATAAEVARHEARGDGVSASAILGRLGSGVSVQRRGQGPLHCVTLSSVPAGGLLSVVEISASGCAAMSEGAR